MKNTAHTNKRINTSTKTFIKICLAGLAISSVASVSVFPHFGAATVLIFSISIVTSFVLAIIAALSIHKALEPLEWLTKHAEKTNYHYLTKLDEKKFCGEYLDVVQLINSLTESVRDGQKNLHKEVIDKTKELNSQIEELKRTKNIMGATMLELRKQKEVIEQQKDGMLYLSLAIENASDSIIITDPDAKVIYANKAIEPLTGYDRLEIIGNNPSMWGKNMSEEFFKNMWDVIKNQKRLFIGDVINTKKDGTKYMAHLRISPVLNEKGNILYFIGLEQDITKEREVDRMKTEFISLASHQLRTPLSAMKWYLEMLIHGDLGVVKPEQLKFIENVNKSNDRMIELVNALLNVSRIESGRLIVDPVDTNIKELITDTLSEVKNRVAAKGLKLNTDLTSNVPTVSIDPKLIRQVLLNIVTNAIKYTPEKGTIDVSIAKTETEIVVCVKDTGYGIPDHAKDKIYTRFYRGENIVGRETDGTGLGLYLAKKIIEVSGGKIWFESKKDAGTTFWFSLPLAGTVPHRGEVVIDS